MLAAAIVVAVAHADQARVDNDLALPGNQNVVELPATPGDTVHTSGRIVVEWNGNRHLAPGDSLTFTADPAATTLPAGYDVQPVTLTVPAVWGPGSAVSGESAVSFSAPRAGHYRYAVRWRAASGRGRKRAEGGSSQTKASVATSPKTPSRPSATRQE